MENQINILKPEGLITLNDFAEFLGVSEIVVRENLRKANIPMLTYKRGRFLISLRTITAYLEAKQKDTQNL